MKKKRFSVEQITAVLKHAEGGIPVGDVCRQAGVSEQTFYRWKKVYGGMCRRGPRVEATARREWPAEATGRRPDLGQGHAAGRRSKKVLKPVKQREVTRYLMGRYGVSTRHACRVVGATRSSVYYISRKDPLTALRHRMRELAQTLVRFGYRRLRVLLQPEAGTSAKSASIACTPRKGWP